MNPRIEAIADVLNMAQIIRGEWCDRHVEGEAKAAVAVLGATEAEITEAEAYIERGFK